MKFEKLDALSENTHNLKNPIIKRRGGSRSIMGIRVIVAVMLTFCAQSAWAQATAPLPEAVHPSAIKADRVIVKKAARMLLVMQEDRILFSFDIVLGGAPEGDKLEEGDWRTPEGRYIIDWRNPNSRFYKSMHISYPSPVDRSESAAESVDPGGMVMIHGYPLKAQTNPGKYEGQDWTDGCIALKNEDMDILWSVVDNGTPIEIFP